ncbi:hypothetical protein SAMN05519103_01768 [Rhizobiales bacterium GAS113]|nr:hypothetical protein SAMN05519103_01768 [Rhizobiales bacterium GAS113]
MAYDDTLSIIQRRQIEVPLDIDDIRLTLELPEGAKVVHFGFYRGSTLGLWYSCPKLEAPPTREYVFQIVRTTAARPSPPFPMVADHRGTVVTNDDDALHLLELRKQPNQ